MPQKTIKAVIVGDQKVGKTCFLSSYAKVDEEFEVEYIPTAFDTFLVRKEKKGTETNLRLFDTSGSSDYQMMRLETYSQTNVFILAFAINDITSYYNVEDVWLKEIDHFGGKDVPKLLVGMKLDKARGKTPSGKAKMFFGEDAKSPVSRSKHQTGRPYSRAESMSEEFISYSKGVMLANKIGAIKYFECSSVSNREGINEVFEEVLNLENR